MRPCTGRALLDGPTGSWISIIVPPWDVRSPDSDVSRWPLSSVTRKRTRRPLSCDRVEMSLGTVILLIPHLYGVAAELDVTTWLMDSLTAKIRYIRRGDLLRINFASRALPSIGEHKWPQQ
jgi:hypothetical protein